eukprot:sb/3467852/
MLLDDLDCYLFEYVLSLCSPSDLSQLCLTSRDLFSRTTDYLTLLFQPDRSQQISEFLEINQHFLLPLERHLFTHITQFPKAQWRRLTVYRVLHDIVPTSLDITRVSVASSHMFSYLGDPLYAYAEYSEPLARDVVYLKGLNWLIFGTDLPLLKGDAESYPAKYRVRLHLQVRPDVHWKGDSPMVIRVLNKSCNEVVRHNFIHPRVWSDLAGGKEPSLEYNGYNDLTNLRIERAPHDTWYFLVIDNIEVKSKDSQLVFSLDDRANVFWKSGKSWDFLEVARL